MKQPLALARADAEETLLAVLKGLEIQRTLGAEPVLTALRHFPAEPARVVDFPEELHPKLRESLLGRGYRGLYTHQREAYELVQEGKDVVVVTPTASGKTLCYNLPVLDRMLKDPDARALYLFPTKALAQDQLAELSAAIEALGKDVATFTYDGDTPQDARPSIRARAHVVITNPDMLHKGILPHHTKWVKLLENLRYVVVDELHSLRGVYGSHVANIFRRLRRLCEFYGSRPQFVCASATIGNPKELAEALTGREMTLVERSGAPRGERYFAIYNPPVVNRQLGIRRSALNAARDVSLSFLGQGLQTIVFAPSRLATEVLVTYLKEALERRPGSEGIVRGYRGGYLPLKRREIEKGLREGSVLGVVSTNALELGIDIGSLDAAVLVGYPGSVASAWQQAGRAGRRTGTSVAVLVANSTPLNQFIAKNPDYFFGAPVEEGRINPDNLQILVNHVKCAAFELPFVGSETFGGEDLGEILRFLEEEKVLHRAGERWHWTSESYPADAVSLRSVSSDNFVVQDVTAEPRIIAEVDYDSAPSMVHEKAVYILEGRTYFVERYDHQERRVHVREADVDYYTDAITTTKVRILERFAEEARRNGRRSHGEVHVTSQVVGFKKIKFHTNENVGAGELTMPENEMHTTAWWLTVPREVMCGLPYGREERRDGVVALSYTLGQLAALFLMCDRHDLGVALGDNGQGEARIERGLRRLGAGKGGRDEPLPGEDYEPNVFVYDAYPGGIGLSEPLYRLHDRLLEESRALIAACPCADGCPSCVGPAGEAGSSGKAVALAILEAVLHPRNPSVADSEESVRSGRPR
ncbi:MAG TPA: DEAD/DEAH box helicase [Vicinamibacteria bacterium]|nr:DEAD/DEAH box helicase [Vicinamibacteria bacterium]